MQTAEDLWRELEGKSLADGIRLLHLHTAHPIPVFAGVWQNPNSEPAGPETPVMVRFWPDDAETGSIYDRHREASFLRHPNLLSCLHAGRTQLPDGSPAIFGVYDQPQAFLSDLMERRAFTESEAATLCEDVIAGLRYLHQNGLVYCNLDRSTVAHVGDRWAVCDYSQLRPQGSGYASETRRLMGSIAGAPPEAFNGVVTPAWDAWSLAHLIRAVLQDPKTARELRTTTGSGRVPRSLALTPPFASITARCLVPDPGARCSLDDIAQQLQAARKQVEEAPGEDPTPEQHSVPEPMESVYNRRTRYDDEERGRLASIPWRALLAGIAAVLLVVLLVKGAKSGGKAAPTPADAVEQQKVAANDSRPTPVDQMATPRVSEGAASATRSRTSDQPSGLVNQNPSSQIEHVVRSWAEAFRRKDMNAEMRFYAPQLRRFFQASNVPSSFVQRTKMTALKDAGDVRLYSIDNLNTHLDGPSAATVTFDKTWDFVGRIRHTGKVRAELKLEKRADQWQIVSERDLKVYRQSRSRV